MRDQVRNSVYLRVETDEEFRTRMLAKYGPVRSTLTNQMHAFELNARMSNALDDYCWGHFKEQRKLLEIVP